MSGRPCLPAHRALRALGLAAASLAVAGAAGAGRDLPIANDSGMTLMEVYVSPAGEAAWSEDLLDVRVVPPGDSVVVLLPGEEGRCDVALRLVFEDGRDRLEAADACAGVGLRLAPRRP